MNIPPREKQSQKTLNSTFWPSFQKDTPECKRICFPAVWITFQRALLLKERICSQRITSFGKGDKYIENRVISFRGESVIAGVPSAEYKVAQRLHG